MGSKEATAVGDRWVGSQGQESWGLRGQGSGQGPLVVVGLVDGCKG